MKTTVELFKLGKSELSLPLMEDGIKAGFPSPAEDFIEIQLDLNKHLINNPLATFIARVRGNSMKNAGINEGDLLVIDRAKDWKPNDIIICEIHGELTVKRLLKDKNGYYLKSNAAPSTEYPDKIYLKAEDKSSVFGVVTYVIHKT